MFKIYYVKFIQDPMYQKSFVSFDFWPYYAEKYKL